MVDTTEPPPSQRRLKLRGSIAGAADQNDRVVHLTIDSQSKVSDKPRRTFGVQHADSDSVRRHAGLPPFLRLADIHQNSLAAREPLNRFIGSQRLGTCP